MRQDRPLLSDVSCWPVPGHSSVLKEGINLLFPTHFVGGALAALSLSPRADPETTLLVALAGGLAALLTDIDSPESFLGSRIPVVPSAVRMTVGHRGPLHSLAAAGVLYALVRWSLPRIFTSWLPGMHLWVFFGYASHLILDMFNPAGVPLLWPVPGRLALPLFQTGGFLERLIVFPVLTGSFLLLLYKRMGGVHF